MSMTDDEMKASLATARGYTIVLLRRTAKRDEAGADAVAWEHGRRNFELRAAGILPIVCPVNDGSEVSGVGILAVPVDEARKVMDDDPGVQAGIFSYELHATWSFPGDQLPG